jgi:cell division protein FtsW
MRGHRADLVLAMGIFALLGIGLIMMYSISPVVAHSYKLFFNQLLYVALGVVVWVVVSNIPYPTWQRLAPAALAAAAFSVLLLIPFGRTSLGATRWVQLGPISFQPAELLKLALIMYLAMWFARRGKGLLELNEGVIPFAVMVGLASIVVVVFQKDLGTAAVLALAALGMYVAAGLRGTHFALLALAGIALVLIAIVMAPHRIGRLTTFLHPTQDPTGAGYHVNQAMIGIGSGGLFGNGLGHSIQVYGYLPEATTDSIFAVMGEEFGLIGALIILALYALVIYRGLLVAAAAPDQFSRFLAAGISLWFCFQALINIGAMLSLVPLTGIPLPYISYGGTNLVVSLVGAGMLVNISRYTTREEGYAPYRQRRGNGRARLAGSSYDRRPTAA